MACHFLCTEPKVCLPKGGQTQSGFSLIEVLMCIAMLALITLPFVLMTTQTGQMARAAYIQSTRTILLNSLKSELAPNDPNFVANYTDGSMNTSVSDSGQVIPYRVAVDTTTSGATNSMKRTTNFYLYNDSADAANAPRYISTLVQYPTLIRQRLGSSAVIDTVGRYWWPSNTLYDSTNKIPGKVGAYSHSATSTNIINTVGTDDSLFQGTIYANPNAFSADVENGAYTVKLYFSEINAGINASSSRRIFNIYLEGVKVNTLGPYSVYESTGGTYRGDFQMYDVNVTDGVLNVTMQGDSATNDCCPTFSAIEIRKRSQL